MRKASPIIFDRSYSVLRVLWRPPGGSFLRKRELPVSGTCGCSGAERASATACHWQPMGRPFTTKGWASSGWPGGQWRRDRTLPGAPPNLMRLSLLAFSNLGATLGGELIKPEARLRPSHKGDSTTIRNSFTHPQQNRAPFLNREISGRLSRLRTKRCSASHPRFRRRHSVRVPYKPGSH